MYQISSGWMSAIIVFILFLWGTGGYGWLRWYEDTQNAKFSFAGKAVTIATYPVVAFLALLGTMWDELRGKEESG